MFRLTFFLLFLSFSTCVLSQEEYTISGYLSDSTSSESIIGGTIYIKGTGKGVATNVYGFYSLTLPKGSYEITYSYLGYKTITQQVELNKNTTLNIPIPPVVTSLQEVEITADARKDEVRSTQMGLIKLPIDQIRKIPTIGGETDIIKVMQLMPGVKAGFEGQNGMYVRGGAADQNLILLDEAVVYNVSHLFGFFSVFNNDAIKDVTLIKGGFPAYYGGRLSSVLDIRMKEGDMQKYHVDGGVGILSSRLTVQGPIIKDKMSFIVSGRRSYVDKVLKLLKVDLPYYFYDLNSKINYKLSDKDRFYLSGYYGDDVLGALGNSSTGAGFKLGNFTTSARWNHIYNSKLFSNISLIHTRFRYDIEANGAGSSFLVKSSISDIGGKIDFNYYHNPENHISYGGSIVNHSFRPNIINTSGEISDFLKSQKGDAIISQEIGLYANNDYNYSSSLKINYGLRNSFLTTKGKVYAGLEPRLSTNYTLSEKQSLKGSYSRMKQYMHLVSSSSFALPTDLWYPATKNVKPLSADQISIGYTRNLEKIKTLFTFETYYKWMRNLIEYREGAVLLLNNNYEDELVSGKGKAYGFEFFLNRTEGKFTGWIGYTISWTKRQFDDINKGKEYFDKYDRRHDISVVGTYDFTKRFSFSAVWIFATGSRFTPLVGNFFMPNASLTSVDMLPIYTEKNAIVLPSTHRLDINFIFKTQDRKKWKGKGEWHIGAYNTYNRAQPQTIQIVSNPDGTYKYQAIGLFGFFPSVAYEFKF